MNDPPLKSKRGELDKQAPYANQGTGRQSCRTVLIEWELNVNL